MMDAGHTSGDATANPDIDNTKRKADHLSPVLSDIDRRYKWDNAELLQKNRFFPIQDEQVSDANHSPTSNNTTSTPTPKIPPIFLSSNYSNHQELTKDIKRMVKNTFTTSCTQDKTKINLTSAEDYKTLTKFYDENNIKYFTYQNPTTRPLSIVIKNIPISITTQEIEEELSIMNIEAQKVTRLFNRNRQPTMVVAVDMVNNEANKNIFKLDKICYAIVRIEPRKSNNNIPQCFRCQRFGHTKNYCNMDYRCVKCLGNHYYKDCTKTQNVPPVCVNCKENHPANYRGCKYYTDQQKSIPRNSNQHRNRQEDTNQPQPSTSFANNTPSQPTTPPTSTTRSYASKTRNDPPPNNNNISSGSPIVDQIMNFLVNLITPYIETIKTYIFTNIIPSLFNAPKK